MFLADHQIRRQALKGMIHPFVDTKRRNPRTGLSYGLSSYGYDICLGTEFKGQRASKVTDLRVDLESIHTKFVEEDPFLLYPGHFILGHSMEYFEIPSNVTGLVKDKSTYARCGIALQNTVLEAGWEGQITLEISNHSQNPVYLFPGQGIAQVLFSVSDQFCHKTYEGNYNEQLGVILPNPNKTGVK